MGKESVSWHATVLFSLQYQIFIHEDRITRLRGGILIVTRYKGNYAFGRADKHAWWVGEFDPMSLLYYFN